MNFELANAQEELKLQRRRMSILQGKLQVERQRVKDRTEEISQQRKEIHQLKAQVQAGKVLTTACKTLADNFTGVAQEELDEKHSKFDCLADSDGCVAHEKIAIIQRLRDAMPILLEVQRTIRFLESRLSQPSPAEE